MLKETKSSEKDLSVADVPHVSISPPQYLDTKTRCISKAHAVFNSEHDINNDHCKLKAINKFERIK